MAGFAYTVGCTPQRAWLRNFSKIFFLILVFWLWEFGAKCWRNANVRKFILHCGKKWYICLKYTTMNQEQKGALAMLEIIEKQSKCLAIMLEIVSTKADLSLKDAEKLYEVKLLMDECNQGLSSLNNQ